MRKTLFLIGCLLLSAFAIAETPKWAGKAVKSVFTLKTFDASGMLIGSCNGFFIGQNGEAVSCFAPFKGAERAVVIDADGKEYAVTYIQGANEMYDVAKFLVDIKKATYLNIASAEASTGAATWLLPYAAKKKPVCPEGAISEAEIFNGDYAYYTLDMNSSEQQVGCPIVNENEEVIGITQPAAGDQSDKTYAVSVRFANDQQLNGLSINDPVFRSTGIAIDVPDNQQDAILSLYVSGAVLNESQYAHYLNRFITKFPKAADGYIYQARLHASKNDYRGADQDMEQALSHADGKDNVHYQYAILICQNIAKMQANNSMYEGWTLETALQHSQEAYRISPLPIYRQQQAQILFDLKQYDKAYSIYMELTNSELDKAEQLFGAAHCKLQSGDEKTALQLADSAVNTFTKPYTKTAAPYLFARGQMLHHTGKYRKAVNDYNEYESLMAAQLKGDFYFLREQAEFAGHLYQQALDDIKTAIEKEPTEIVYYAEKANIELRVGMIDEAISTAEKTISMQPRYSDGYLFLGVAQCVKGQKTEGLQNLNKAKELGNSQAQTLIDKYSN